MKDEAGSDPATGQRVRVLLVEHDRRAGEELIRASQHAGYHVDWIQWGCNLRPALHSARYACVLLGLDLPDLPGDAALQVVRECDPALLLVVMTSPCEASDRIRLLDLGADDHVTRPVAPEELAARLRALLRRARRTEPPAALEHGPLSMRVDLRSASWRGREVTLTNMEFWLLEMLVRRKQQVLSRATLEQMLYGWGEQTGSNTVQVYVHHLRRKFDRRLIRTLRGIGYQIAPEAALAADRLV